MKPIAMIALFLMIGIGTSLTATSQVLPQLSQYLGSGTIQAQVVTVDAARNFTSYGHCQLVRSGNKLFGTYQQAFSDRSQFMGKKDVIDLEIDLTTGAVTMVLVSWGRGRETFAAQVQPNGKLLVSATNQAVVTVGLSQIP